MNNENIHASDVSIKHDVLIHIFLFVQANDNRMFRCL